MKSLITLVLLTAFLFASCSKKADVKLELFSTEAFTFDTGSGWEVNFMTRVKGYQQLENNGKFSASFSYQIGIIKPQGDTIKGMISKVEDKTEIEKVSDTSIESQFELDSTYIPGAYKIIISVKDVNSGKTASSTIPLELKKD